MAAETSPSATCTAEMTRLIRNHDHALPMTGASGRPRRFARTRVVSSLAGTGAAVALATVATAAASTPRPTIGLGGRVPRPSIGLGGRAPAAPLTVTPGRSIIDVSVGMPASRYFAKSGAYEVAKHLFAVNYGNNQTVRAHVNQRGLVDGITSTSRRLELYGQPLRLGFSRLSARLERAGWQEGRCAGGDGHFAAITTGRRTTAIVWTSHGSAVAIGTPRSAFLRTATNCKPLG